jgi:hypothetical protein
VISVIIFVLLFEKIIFPISNQSNVGDLTSHRKQEGAARMNRQRKEKVVEIDQHRLIQKGDSSELRAERHYESFLDKLRDKILARVEE